MIKNSWEKSITNMFSGVMVVTVAFFISNVSSYLTQLYLGRTLSVADYGLYSSLLSILTVFGVFSSVLGISVVKIVSEIAGKVSSGYLNKLFWTLSRIFFTLGLILFILFFLLKKQVVYLLSIDDTRAFLVMVLCLAFSMLYAIPQSFLKGLLRFKDFSIVTVLNSLLFLFLIILVLRNRPGVSEAYICLLLTQIIMYVVGTLLLKKNFERLQGVDVVLYVKRVFGFSGSVLMIQLCLSLINNLDIVLVKKYMDSYQAGYYAGANTLGKIILFGAGYVTVVMFPQISALKSAGKPYLDKFKYALYLQLFLIISSTGIFYIFPDYIAHLFFGDRFVGSIPYLRGFSLFMGLYVFARFLVMFFLAINRTKIYYLLVPLTAIQFMLVTIYHSNVYEVININIYTTLLLVVSLLLYLRKVLKIERVSAIL